MITKFVWALHKLFTLSGRVTFHIRAVPEGTEVPRDPEDGVGTYVSLHKTQEEALLEIITAINNELSAKKTPKVNEESLKTSKVINPHSIISTKPSHYQGPTGKSICGASSVGPWEPAACEVVCLRCVKMLKARGLIN